MKLKAIRLTEAGGKLDVAGNPINLGIVLWAGVIDDYKLKTRGIFKSPHMVVTNSHSYWGGLMEDVPQKRSIKDVDFKDPPRGMDFKPISHAKSESMRFASAWINQHRLCYCNIWKSDWTSDFLGGEIPWSKRVRLTTTLTLAGESGVLTGQVARKCPYWPQ